MENMEINGERGFKQTIPLWAESEHFLDQLNNNPQGEHK